MEKLIAVLKVLTAAKQTIKSLRFDSKPRKEDLQAALDFYEQTHGPRYQLDELRHMQTTTETVENQETVNPGGAWDADEQLDEYGDPIETEEDPDTSFKFYKNYDIKKGAFKGYDLPKLIKALETEDQSPDDMESERSYSYLNQYYKNGVLKIPPIIQIDGYVVDGFGRIFLAWALGVSKIKVVNYNL